MRVVAVVHVCGVREGGLVAPVARHSCGVMGAF